MLLGKFMTRIPGAPLVSKFCLFLFTFLSRMT